MIMIGRRGIADLIRRYVKAKLLLWYALSVLRAYKHPGHCFEAAILRLQHIASSRWTMREHYNEARVILAINAARRLRLSLCQAILYRSRSA